MKKLTFEQFEHRANLIHHGKYQYNKSTYVNTQTKMDIICPLHGTFAQVPTLHISQCQGCPSCGNISKGINQRTSIDNFILQSNAIHGNKYDYSQSNYIRTHEKLKIICKLHGVFLQTPASHLQGNGCPHCAGNITKSVITFIAQANLIHNNKYDYSKMEYINMRCKLIIICPFHGDFIQLAYNHLYGKKGCPYCAKNKKYTTSEFIDKANAIHNEKYNYSLVNYINSYTKIKIICNKHGIFEQLPSDHLCGKGCHRCTHLISKAEIEFLDYFNIKHRNYRLPEWKQKAVDGFDKDTNTIYEFLGDYWHGNLKTYNKNSIHPVMKKTYGELNMNTFIIFDKILNLKYRIKYIWESDWKNFKLGIDLVPNIANLEPLNF